MEPDLYNCCVCFSQYDRVDRIPKIIISCGQTICSYCLDNILSSDQLKCPLDRTIIPAAYRNSKLFPTNIILMQILDAKLKSENELCSFHKEPNVFVCTLDKCRVCQYCVDFGNHRGHPIKRAWDVQAEANDKKAQLEAVIKEFQKYYDLINRSIEEDKKPLVTARFSKFGLLNDLLDKKERELRDEIMSLFARERLIAEDHFQKTLVLEKLNKADDNKEESKILIEKDGQQNKKAPEEEKKLENFIKELKGKVEAQINSFEKPLVSLLEGISSKVPATEEERSKLKFSVIKNILRFQNESNRLIISPIICDSDGVVPKQEGFLKNVKWCTIKNVTLDFTISKLTEEIVQSLYLIWNEMKAIVDLDVKLNHKELGDEVLSIFCKYGFWASPKLKVFELTLEGCPVTNESISKLMTECL